MNNRRKTNSTAQTERVTCAFCKGKGKDPFNLLSPLSTCQICGGLGHHILESPIARCAYCRGSGVHPFSRMTCTTCRGVGSITVPVNAIPCPGCGGSGQESDHKFFDSVLSCTVCRGKGMVAAGKRLPTIQKSPSGSSQVKYGKKRVRN
jgi:DnaJ-class molecular chaperone